MGSQGHTKPAPHAAANITDNSGLARTRLPASPLEEGMVVVSDAERRKRARNGVDINNAQPASGNEGAGAQSSGYDSHQQKQSHTVDLLLI